MSEYPIHHMTYVEIDGTPTEPFSAGSILNKDALALPEPYLGCLLDLLNMEPDEGTCSTPNCKHPVGWYLGGDDDHVAWAFTVLATDDVEDDILAMCEDHHPGLPILNLYDTRVAAGPVAVPIHLIEGS